MRLLSICPPEALRPYYQEGYVAGTDEVTTRFDNKDELDFNQRLIAKFRLRNDGGFWRGGFRGLPQKSLYPPNDQIENLCARLRYELDTGPTAGRIGAFLKEWSDLEAEVVGWARQQSSARSVQSVREALDVLRQTESLSLDTLGVLHYLRRLRNEVVHRPDRADPQTVIRGTDMLRDAKRELAGARKNL